MKYLKSNERIESLRDEINRNPRLWKTTKFTGKLLIAGIVFRTIIFLNPDTYFLQSYLASIISFLTSLSGKVFETQGALLIGDGTNYLITRDCLGWKSVSVFAGLVFASSKKISDKIGFLMVGTVLLVVANIVRVWSTILLSEAGIISFDIIHGFLWTWGMTALVILMWYLWLENPGRLEIRGIFK